MVDERTFENIYKHKMEDIAFISENKDGNFYVGFKVKVPRGIKRKNESKADELLIVGFTKEKFNEWLKENNYTLVRK